MKTIVYILIAAGITYLIRAVPVVCLHERIHSRFLRSFLYYVPYATLSCLTFPSILFCTDSIVSAAVGSAVAVILALRGRSLITVAAAACAAVFLTELLCTALL